MTTYTREDFENAVHVIRGKTNLVPRVGLVLGSGLGGLADRLEGRVAVADHEIPGWPVSTVEGHQGKLVFGTLEGVPVVAQQGRAHFYEGYSLQQATFPIRVMQHLGVQTLILTNAAGGLNTAYHTGDVMMLNDHINFPGMVGHNPLMGPNDDRVGPRFLGMVQTYDRGLRAVARQVAQAEGLLLHEGVYVCLSGPSFETPAEIRMLRMIGGDAVGMSTVHEVLVARHMGVQVMAFSGITNEAIDSVDVDLETNHQEVLDAGKVIVPKLEQLVRGVLRSL